MLKYAFLLALSLTTAIGSQQRIIGGSVTTIGQYPFAAALLTSFNQNLVQSCGGTIINNRSVLTAAHCVFIYAPSRYFVRVGSTNAHSGGTVYSVSQVFNHAGYSVGAPNNDISVIRVSTAFSFGTNVRVGRIAGSNYNIADNQVVWAIGWGVISAQGQTTEQLRHVQIWTVNQNTCRNNYANYYAITNNMLCAGYLNVGGRDTCNRDSGGPLLHNGVVVGVVSHGRECGSARYPGIYTRVSNYANWIRDRA